MKLHLVKSFLVILLFICLAAALLSTLSSPVFLLSLFNGTVLAVIVGTRERSPPEEEVDYVWNSFRCSYGARDYTWHDVVRNSDANVHDDGGYEDKDYGTCYEAKNEACESKGDDGCKEDEESKDDDVKGCEEEEELDGYDEDDDEDGTEGEVGWDDEDEEDEEQEDEVVDDNLDERAQEFITKVTRGWRDELIREHQKWLA